MRRHSVMKKRFKTHRSTTPVSVLNGTLAAGLGQRPNRRGESLRQASASLARKQLTLENSDDSAESPPTPAKEPCESMNDLETLKFVCEQRDCLKEALANLVDAFWSAHYNHTFDSEDRREDPKEKDENGKPKTYRCSAGRSLRDCFRGCDLFDKKGVCKGYDCPMGFHHRHIYERVREAHKVLDERSAEFKPFDIDRIPKYDATKTYEITAAWYARMCLMFFNGFSLSKEYNKETSKKLGNAAQNLVSIGLASFGLHCPLDCVEDEKNGKKVSPDDPRIIAWHESMKPLIDKFGDRESQIEKNGLMNCIDLFTNDKEFARWYIVRQSLVFLGEYAFGHDYPSADLGVYHDVLGGLTWVCARVCGFQENNFDIIQNLNDESFDTIGFKSGQSADGGLGDKSTQMDTL